MSSLPHDHQATMNTEPKSSPQLRLMLTGLHRVDRDPSQARLLMSTDVCSKPEC